VDHWTIDASNHVVEVEHHPVRSSNGVGQEFHREIRRYCGVVDGLCRVVREFCGVFLRRGKTNLRASVFGVMRGYPPLSPR
jgi:hypothetical protein